jgi:hypothetical protein
MLADFGYGCSETVVCWAVMNLRAEHFTTERCLLMVPKAALAR